MHVRDVHVHVQARLRFSEEVQQSDVDEGIRLMYESKRTLYEEASPAQRAYDPTSTIFEMAKNVALASDSSTIKVADLEQRALMKGVTRAQVLECIKQYETLSVWMQVTNASPSLSPSHFLPLGFKEKAFSF